MREAARDAARAGAFLLPLAGLVWATGRPFLFPSLGPSAYLLAVRPDAGSTSGRRFVGGHALGVVAGLLTYHALAAGIDVTAVPTAAASVRVGASAVGSVALTTGAMRATGLVHAPACATTLIVALGLLPTVADGAVILLGVVVLLAAARAADYLVAGAGRTFLA